VRDCLASLGWVGRGRAMGAGSRHACEWSDDFSLSTMRVRDFLLLIDILHAWRKL
jgi:hypothetical protein